MMQVKKIAGVIAAGAILFAGAAIADGRQDYYTQTEVLGFFNNPQNARTIGMAGSSVATSSDSSSVVGNPAGLGWLKDADVSATYYRNQISGDDSSNSHEIQADVDGGQALASIPLVPTLDGTPRYGSLGFGWAGFKADSDTVADDSYKNYSLNLAYGKDLSDQASVGYAIAYNQNKQEQKGGASAKLTDGVNQTVGLQYKTSKDTTWGVSTHYGFGSYDYKGSYPRAKASTTTEDVSNWGADLGWGHQIGKTLWTASTDYNLYNSQYRDDFGAWNFRVGLEQSLTQSIKGRLGYRYAAIVGNDLGNDNNNVKYSAVSLGLGFNLAKWLTADYGTEYRHVGDGSDWSHYVTLSVPFSLCNS